MLDDIRERKLVQWVVAYAAAAFVVVSGLEVITEAFPAWTVLLRTALVLVFTGLPIIVVVGWFHGEKGRQRVPPAEVALICLILVVAGVLTWQLDVYGSSAEPAVSELPAIELDSTRLAVMPFRRGPGLPSMANDEIQIQDALAEWSGLELVDHLYVREMAERENWDARRTALAVGAGRYVDGSKASVREGIRLSVDLFDTRGGTRIAQATGLIRTGRTLSDTAAERIVGELLFDIAWGLKPEDDKPGTDSYPARRSFLAAMDALDRWQLAEADSLMGEAIRHDPRYARALLWRAQVRAWDGRDPSELLGLVETAQAHLGGLTRREERLAEGLGHLGRGEFAQACAAYDSLRSLDERDFAAWFGLGECRALDKVVVRSSRSPSGWAFRSSYRQAVRAYTRAFELLPAVFRGVSSRTFEQVGKRLRVSTGTLSRGMALPPDTIQFLARAALLDDTLAFVPFPMRDVMASNRSTRLPTHQAAVERQRRLYNNIAEGWAAAFPRDREALAALAQTREMLADPRALETLDAAIAVTHDPNDRLLLLLERVSLLIKFGAPDRFPEARSLADSVLRAATPVTNRDFQRLAVAATLAGRPHGAARMAARGAEAQDWNPFLPVAVTSPAEGLTVYAAMGGPVDSLHSYERTVEAALLNRIPPPERDAARARLLARAASLAFVTHPLDCFRRMRDLSTYLALQAEVAFADGRVQDASRILAEARDIRVRGEIPAAETSYDALFAEAWLWAQIGDTAQAIVMLDGTLNTRRWSQPNSLGHPALAASFVRAMALRAKLAAATGDPDTARRWAEAVLALWGDADPALQPVTEPMRQILEAPPTGADRLSMFNLPRGGSRWNRDCCYEPRAASRSWHAWLD